MDALANALVFKNLGIIKRSFGLLGNFGHGAHRLQRIFAGRCFAAEHNIVSTVKNCIGNIACFRTGCAVTGNHAFKHLRRGNYRLACLIAAADDIFLYQRHNFGRYFHAEVTAGNHNAVGNGNNFFNIFYTGMVFNFGYNAHGRTDFFQHAAYSKHVICFLHKRSRNIIHAEFCGKSNVADILFGQKRQFQFHTGAGYAFARADFAAMHNFGVNFTALYINISYFKRQKPVRKKNCVAGLQFFRQTGVIYIGNFLRAFNFFCCKRKTVALF